MTNHSPFARTLLVAAALALTPAVAHAAAPAGISGIAFVNLAAIVEHSQAYTAAQTARQTTYKPQFDQATARRNAIQAQLQPLVEKAQRDSQTAGFNQTTLQQEVAQIQSLQDSGNHELQTIMQPVALSEAYAQEQINAKLNDAVKAAMSKNGVSLLLRQEAVVWGVEAANLNPQVLTELNAALPSVQIVPPAGWQPQEVRDQQAAAAGAGARGTGTDGR